MIQTVSPTDARVLILGESGTGKGTGWPRAALPEPAPFRQATCAVNCPPFRKRFWKANCSATRKRFHRCRLKTKMGRVEEADGGVFFSMKIADMSRPLQAKLLRFFEDGTFTRVGGTQNCAWDVRLIAATNRDIIEAIRENEFREDFSIASTWCSFVSRPCASVIRSVLLWPQHFLSIFPPPSKSPRKSFPVRAQITASPPPLAPCNGAGMRSVIDRASSSKPRMKSSPATCRDFQIEPACARPPTPTRPSRGNHSTK